MSYFGWKNNPIYWLHATDDYASQATESKFIEWKDGVQCSMAAVSAGYISRMITYFENSVTVVPMFDNIGVQINAYGRADYNSVPFNRAVVGLASLCGKNFQLLNFMNVDADLWKENACKTHHSNVFLANNSTITAHPLREVIEWKLLELSFNPFKASSAENNWVELQEAIMIDLSLNFDSLTSHMAHITLLHNKAVSCSSEQDIDSKIFGTLIKKLQEADGDESLLPVRIWRAASTKWYTNHQKDLSSVQWSELKLAVSKELLWFKSPDSSSSSKRPKLHPPVPPGVAFPAISAGAIYDIAMQAISDQRSAAPPGSECWNCGHNCNTVALIKGKGSEGSEGSEGPEGLEGEEIQGLWAEEGECLAEFTPGVKEARDCRAEFTPGLEGARDCREEFTQGVEGVRDCRAEFTPGAEGAKDCQAEFTQGAEGAGQEPEGLAQANTAFHAAQAQANADHAAAFVAQYEDGFESFEAQEGAYSVEQDGYDDPDQSYATDEQSFGAFTSGTFANPDRVDHPGLGAMYPGRSAQLGAQFRDDEGDVCRPCKSCSASVFYPAGAFDPSLATIDKSENENKISSCSFPSDPSDIVIDIASEITRPSKPVCGGGDKTGYFSWLINGTKISPSLVFMFMTCCLWLSFGVSLASNLAGVVRFPHTAISSLLSMTIVAVLVLTFLASAAG
eukprot:3933979-Rhodomonas_salina.1